MSVFGAARSCVAALAGGLLAACNLEEGLKKTPSVLSPDQVATIEGPGTRLLSGSYHGLTYGGELLFARRTLGPENALTIVDPQRQSACELAGAARFGHAGLNWIAHAASLDADNQGEIHFSRTDCSALPLTLGRATLPFALVSDTQAVLLAGDTLYLVDPLTSEQRVLASNYRGAQRVYVRDSNTYVWFVQGDDQLIEFDLEWNELARIGQSVGAAATTPWSSTLVIEDGSALAFVSVQNDGSLLRFPLADDGCAPHAPSDDTFTYLSPCGERRLHSLTIRHGDIDYGAIDVDPQYAWPISLGLHPDGITRLFYLRDVDATNHTGSLWSLDVPEDQHQWSPADASESLASPSLIGEHADLDWLHEGTLEETYALVDIENGVGRAIVVPRHGEPQELVTSVPHTPANLWYFGREYWFFGNAQGTRTDLVRICKLAGCNDVANPGLAVETVAERVPDRGFASSVDDLRVALLHDASDGVGTLSIEGGPRVADGVPAAGFAGLYRIMELGVAYITRFDRELGSGSLEYWNLALDARGLVAENVSEFIRAEWPHVGLVYVVPSGDKAGIWYAPGK